MAGKNAFMRREAARMETQRPPEQSPYRLNLVEGDRLIVSASGIQLTVRIYDDYIVVDADDGDSASFYGGHAQAKERGE